MVDTLSPEKRSWNMSRVRGKDTRPERAVRSLLHKQGYRFTVNGPKNKALPGKPDIVLPKYNAVIFVHGCYWHRHRGCKRATMPDSNVSFWQDKFDKNVARDRRSQRALRKMGWNVCVIWECTLKDQDGVTRRLEKFLTKLRRD